MRGAVASFGAHGHKAACETINCSLKSFVPRLKVVAGRPAAVCCWLVSISCISPGIGSVACAGFFAEQLNYNGGKVVGQCRVMGLGVFRLAGNMGVNKLYCICIGEGRLACGHVVQGGAKAVKVCTLVYWPVYASGLFWGHVGRYYPVVGLLAYQFKAGAYLYGAVIVYDMVLACGVFTIILAGLISRCRMLLVCRWFKARNRLRMLWYMRSAAIGPA